MAYPTSHPSSSSLDPSLAFLTAPVLAGLVLLRQSGQMLHQMSQFSESLLQGEQLPILDRASGYSAPKAEALPYKNAGSLDSQT